MKLDPKLFNLPEEVEIRICTHVYTRLDLAYKGISVSRKNMVCLEEEAFSMVTQELIDDMYLELKEDVSNMLDGIENFREELK